MPKIIPAPDDLSKPFWDAVNEKRLSVQNCTACDRLQYPPRQTCFACGSAEMLEWKDVEVCAVDVYNCLCVASSSAADVSQDFCFIVVTHFKISCPGGEDNFFLLSTVQLDVIFPLFFVQSIPFPSAAVVWGISSVVDGDLYFLDVILDVHPQAD